MYEVRRCDCQGCQRHEDGRCRTLRGSACAGGCAERNAKLYKALEGLRGAVKATCHGDALECAKYEHNVIIPAMAAVREQADELETLVGKEYWPFPTYDDLLFNV